MLPLRDFALILIVVVAWGSNFTAMRIVLDELPPLLFAGLRYAILIPLIPFFRKPASWRALALAGLLLHMGQFGFLFSGMAAGVSAGLASLLLQTQAPLTILMAALFMGERIKPIQALGVIIACAGLLAIAATSGGNVTLIGLFLVLCGASSWALGNLLLKRLPGINMAALFIWSSLFPPLPMLGLSYLLEGPAPFAAIASLSWAAWSALIYIALAATVLGFSIWGTLLAKHPAVMVTPFALLIPVVGLSVAAIALGERITSTEALCCATILAGIALTVLGPLIRRHHAPAPR